MKQDNYILFGKIIKPHGVKGEVRIDLKKNVTLEDNQESVFIEIDGKQVPFFIESFSDKGPFVVMKLEGVDSFDQANTLKAKSCFYESSSQENDEATPDLHDLISFQVEDTQAGIIGKVIAIEEGAQSRLVVDKEGVEILIPFANEIIIKVDPGSMKILVALPDGFLDIYL